MYKPPPADLPNRVPLIHVSTDSDIWYRSHSMTNCPLFFGKAMAGRWDAPAGEYGVLYLGSDEYCAFMESIGRGVLRTRMVSRDQVEQRGFSKIRFTKPLRLIDLVSSGGLTRIGAEASVSSGSGYKNSQRWSKVLHEHPEKPDGIFYLSRHDPSRTACALYDHCASLAKFWGPHSGGTPMQCCLLRFWITMTLPWNDDDSGDSGVEGTMKDARITHPDDGGHPDGLQWLMLDKESKFAYVLGFVEPSRSPYIKDARLDDVHRDGSKNRCEFISYL